MGQITGINGVKVDNYATANTILIAPAMAVAFSVVVGNAGLVANAAGRKILKAGAPLFGSLLTRSTAFVAATSTGTAPVVSNAVGIILHDTDVTDGNSNAQVVVFGFVDTTKLSAQPAAEVVTALNAKITYVNGNA